MRKTLATLIQTGPYYDGPTGPIYQGYVPFERHEFEILYRGFNKIQVDLTGVVTTLEEPFDEPLQPRSEVQKLGRQVRKGASPTQMRAAHNILAKFEDGAHYAILWAPCQSGKTGTFHTLIRESLERGLVDRAYIICPSSEVVLRTQAHEDAALYNPDHLTNISIIFHSQFKTTTMNTANALIVVDESHMVQSKEQEFHHFLMRHRLTMDGNPAHLTSTYIVSVDATPYSELATLEHEQTPFSKHIELLEPGPGYRGLREFQRRKLIQATFSIKDDPARFMSLLEANKYALLRNHDLETEELIIRSCRGIAAVRFYTSARTEIAITRKEQKDSRFPIQCLEDAPDVPTVVLLRGRLHAGKVVPKQHIAFVWEGSNSSKSDTLIQGLTGRMCGYHEFEPRIFVPESFITEEEERAVTESEFQRAISGGNMIPRKATNLLKGAVHQRPPERTPCVPFRIDANGAMDGAMDNAATIKMCKAKGRELLTRNREVLRKQLEASTTPEQQREILAVIDNPSKNIHVRLMTEDSTKAYVRFYKSILEGYANQKVLREHVATFPDLTLVFAKATTSSDARHVFVLCYTTADGPIEKVHYADRIPMESGKSIFSEDKTRFMDVKTEIQDPVKLENALRESILAGAGLECNCRLRKDAFTFVGPTDNDIERICRKLEAELSTELGTKRIVAKYGSIGKEYFNLVRLTW